MTAERTEQLRLNHNFTGLEKSHALMECLNEIERLQTKVAQLELDKQRMAEAIYRLVGKPERRVSET